MLARCCVLTVRRRRPNSASQNKRLAEAHSSAQDAVAAAKAAAETADVQRVRPRACLLFTDSPARRHLLAQAVTTAVLPLTLSLFSRPQDAAIADMQQQLSAAQAAASAAQREHAKALSEAANKAAGLQSKIKVLYHTQPV